MSKAPSTAEAKPRNRAVQLELSGAAIGYPGQVLLPDATLQVRSGDFLAIVGPNGAGKTTVLRTLLGIIPPLGGRVEAHGRLGYSPQRNALDPIWPFTTAEVVAMGLRAASTEEREEGEGVRSAEALRARVAEALSACGLSGIEDRAFRELSGGQKQRALVARALVSDPDVLILDEPTNDLDLAGEHGVMQLVSELHESGRTVVMVSHLLAVVARYAKRLAFLHEGSLDSGPLEEMLTSERLQAIYGIPVGVHAVDGRRIVVPGSGSDPQ